LPEKLARAAERAARRDRLTKSALVREALQLYLSERRWRALQRATSVRAQALGIRTEDDVDRLVHELRR
jgi:metal-responsive CopG/Arc/MetJ family transcriptional regulator